MWVGDAGPPGSRQVLAFILNGRGDLTEPVFKGNSTQSKTCAIK